MAATPPPPSSPSPSSPKPQPSQHVFQAPTGTRDFYPAELNRLRYIQDAWRKTSINHGFEEIDGPTFEHLELYTAKSGEGIVSELFSFERFGGEKTFALRPEFTPTLARMYASKAASLPKPTKWFWQQNCYRAERPQRGRLREFSQWNCDIIGDDSAAADAECIATCIGVLASLGLKSSDVVVKISNRNVVAIALLSCGVDASQLERALSLLDKRDRTSPIEFEKHAVECGLRVGDYDQWMASFQRRADEAVLAVQASDESSFAKLAESSNDSFNHTLRLIRELHGSGIMSWCKFDLSIVRGIAYYTGTVFEVIVDGERAVAGGGRYDKLIETFGGPPTPAVGFGMGDVVLSLVLQDKGLMPKDDEIAERLGQRPDALVIAYEDKNDALKSAAAEAAIAPTLAALRRGVDGKPGLHARRSYKTTKNVGKLIQDAAKARARYCVIIESATTAQLKNMDTQEQKPVNLSDLPNLIAQR